MGLVVGLGSGAGGMRQAGASIATLAEAQSVGSGQPQGGGLTWRRGKPGGGMPLLAEGERGIAGGYP